MDEDREDPCQLNSGSSAIFYITPIVKRTKKYKMTKNIKKYLHETMDKKAGIDHSSHKTKIVATVGPACDAYD